MKSSLIIGGFLLIHLPLFAMENNNNLFRIGKDAQSEIVKMVGVAIGIGSLLPDAQDNKFLKLHLKIGNQLSDFNDMSALGFYYDVRGKLGQDSCFMNLLGFAQEMTNDFKKEPTSERLYDLAKTQWELLAINGKFFIEKEIEQSSTIRFPKHYKKDMSKKTPPEFIKELFEKNKNISEEEYPILLGSFLCLDYLRKIRVGFDSIRIEQIL